MMSSSRPRPSTARTCTRTWPRCSRSALRPMAQHGSARQSSEAASFRERRSIGISGGVLRLSVSSLAHISLVRGVAFSTSPSALPLPTGVPSFNERQRCSPCFRCSLRSTGSLATLQKCASTLSLHCAFCTSISGGRIQGSTESKSCRWDGRHAGLKRVAWVAAMDGIVERGPSKESTTAMSSRPSGGVVPRANLQRVGPVPGVLGC